MSYKNNIILSIIKEYIEKYIDKIISNTSSLKESKLKDIARSSRNEIINNIFKYNSNIVYKINNFIKIYIDDLYKYYRDSGYEVVMYDANVTLQYQGLVGTSSGLSRIIFEIGLDWDLHLDVPVIRGSSLKGAVAGFYESLLIEKGCECKKDCHANRLREMCADVDDLRGIVDSLRMLFGAVRPSRRELEGKLWYGSGLLVFSDVYPVEANDDGLVVMPHVITPHYYSGGEVVRYEYEASPSPLQHIVLAPGSKWKFIVAFDKADEKAVKNAVEMVLSLVDHEDGVASAGEGVLLLVMYALSSGGVGARTTKGYGFFEFDNIETSGV